MGAAQSPPSKWALDGWKSCQGKERQDSDWRPFEAARGPMAASDEDAELSDKQSDEPSDELSDDDSEFLDVQVVSEWPN